jgi:demethylmenaquinone methyltransferase/2-methoxy-6-polyprenyl-1,4-benzoquinol methylase
MASPLPTPGAPEKQAVRTMFDRIARRYDLINRLLSFGIDQGWRRAAVAYLEAPEDARILDLCTGTADLLLEALAPAPSRRGLGLDFSVPMLRRARAKLERHGLLGRAGVLAGDAERLPLREKRFDGALIAFGIRNVPDPEAALREIRRVLVPGGRVVVLEFSTPRGVVGALYRLYSRHVLPRVGGLISGDPGAYAYLPASIERFPSPADFAAVLERAGFARVRHRPLTFGIAQLHRGERPA